MVLDARTARPAPPVPPRAGGADWWDDGLVPRLGAKLLATLRDLPGAASTRRPRQPGAERLSTSVAARQGELLAALGQPVTTVLYVPRIQVVRWQGT